MRKLLYGTAIAVAVLMIVVGLIGSLFMNNEWFVPPIFVGLVVFGIGCWGYSGGQCDNCYRKDCICRKPEKPKVEKEKC